ncbi:unnamed protein product, partial [Amoebophrya sp. A25]
GTARVEDDDLLLEEAEDATAATGSKEHDDESSDAEDSSSTSEALLTCRGPGSAMLKPTHSVSSAAPSQYQSEEAYPLYPTPSHIDLLQQTPPG